MEDDYSYFARRAREEREAAAEAEDPSVRAIHHELAGRYADLAEAFRSRGAAEG